MKLRYVSQIIISLKIPANLVIAILLCLLVFKVVIALVAVLKIFTLIIFIMIGIKYKILIVAKRYIFAILTILTIGVVFFKITCMMRVGLRNSEEFSWIMTWANANNFAIQKQIKYL